MLQSHLISSHINQTNSPDGLAFGVGQVEVGMSVVDGNRLALNLIAPAGKVSVTGETNSIQISQKRIDYMLRTDLKV